MARPIRESIDTELGHEIKCSRCEEFWPADPEFFYFSAGRPHSWCKACYANDPKMIAKKQRWLAREAAKRAPQHEQV